jgi:hypothetical protein
MAGILENKSPGSIPVSHGIKLERDILDWTFVPNANRDIAGQE